MYLSKLLEGTKAVQNSECWLNTFMDFGSIHREIQVLDKIYTLCSVTH